MALARISKQILRLTGGANSCLGAPLGHLVTKPSGGVGQENFSD
jgi:hypothetical protein